MTNNREDSIIRLIHREVKPALGCTEPIAVALAAAKAVEIIIDKCACCKDECAEQWRLHAEVSIEVEVSGNILKNGMGVGIPGTGMVGLHIAAAMGAVCGKSGLGLEVLSQLTEDAVERAKELVKEGRVKIHLADTDHKLYVKANVSLDGHEAAAEATGISSESHGKSGIFALRNASALIEDVHDRIVETTFEGKVLSSLGEQSRHDADATDEEPYDFTVKEFWDFANTVDYSKIRFILGARDLNLALAKEGLKGNYGLQVGKSIKQNVSGFFGRDFLSYAMSLTAAASDARMAGCTMAAMSNSGSGNQGITVSMPVIAYAIKHKIDDERLARALILSNLTAIHIKSYLGKLSALCGCVVASTGSSCGIVYLAGGNYGQVCYAIKNMIGNITGMVCDGAKVGCAMKVASGVSSSIQSAMLALNDTTVTENDGIIDKDIEKTIRNLGRIGSKGMQATDEMILDIMVCK